MAGGAKCAEVMSLPLMQVRMTIVRLKSGGLWVHAPIAPTSMTSLPLPSVCLLVFFALLLASAGSSALRASRVWFDWQGNVCGWCGNWRRKLERGSSTLFCRRLDVGACAVLCVLSCPCVESTRLSLRILHALAADEHKIFVGPFSRRFPKAEVWVAPR